MNKRTVNRILIFMITLLSAPFIMAENLTIIRLTGNTVKIGNRILKVGSIFDDSQPITWTSPKQILEAKNNRTGAIYRMSASQFASKKGVSSVKDFFLRVNKASTRNVGDTDYRFITSSNSAKFPERRIALLIGNANYTNISSLKNPAYDVAVMSETLNSLGFDVIEAYDCNYTDMTTALNSFAAKAKNYDVALFYYSGHGLQESGHNYLIPVNANLEFKSELTRCMDAFDVIDRIEGSGVDTRIICFDACRDVKTSWTRSSSHGLTTMEGSPGTAIICSTRSGQVALDGETDNSPFVTSMVNAMAEKGSGFSDMMSKVVKKTYESTDRKQCPIVNGTLLTDFVFNSSGTQIKTLKPSAISKASVGGSSSHIPTSTTTNNRQTTTPVRPQSTTIIAEGGVSGLKISVSPAKRIGRDLLVDIVFLNTTSKSMTASFVGKEPCAGYDDYVTSAWDDQGNCYELERGSITVFKGTERLYNCSLTVPAGVPLKVSLKISNVPSDVNVLPLLSLAFRNLNPYEYYGQALARARNIVVAQ